MTVAPLQWPNAPMRTLIRKDDKPYQCPPQVGGIPVLTLLDMDIISRHARSILAWQLSTGTGEHSPSSEPLIQSVFSHRGRFGRDGRRVGRGQQEQVVALRSIDKSVIDWKCSPEATLFNRESFSQEAPGGVPPGAAWSARQGTMPVTSVLFTPLSITQRMSCHCPIIFVYCI